MSLISGEAIGGEVGVWVDDGLGYFPSFLAVFLGGYLLRKFLIDLIFGLLGGEAGEDAGAEFGIFVDGRPDSTHELFWGVIAFLEMRSNDGLEVVVVGVDEELGGGVG